MSKNDKLSTIGVISMVILILTIVNLVMVFMGTTNYRALWYVMMVAFVLAAINQTLYKSITK